MHGRTQTAFCDLRKCFTKTDELKIIKTFLDDHPEILILKVDKSKNLEIAKKSDYERKLLDIFEDTNKFQPLSKNPLENDISRFRKVLNTIEKSVSPSTFNNMKPKESLKKGFGILKKHKDLEPVRPIISSCNSVTEGAEQFLAKLISPIVDKCTFSVKSTKAFKDLFLQKRDLFQSDFEIISFDATSLFSNININRVVDYILDTIFESYESAREYFNQTYFNKNGFEQLVEKLLEHSSSKF